MAEEHKICDFEECEEGGEYPAPQKKILPESCVFSGGDGYQFENTENKSNKYWFCLEHVRQYNKGWDFFSDMNMGEIEDFQKDAVTGHRVTTSTKGRMSFRPKTEEEVYNDAQRARAGDYSYLDENQEAPKSELDAMRVLGLSYPINQKEIKIRYRKLVKQYHPDTNGVENEEKFKIINQAYSCLKELK